MLHFTSWGWTPLHFNFFSSKNASNEIWAVSDINYWSKQWTHFALGPCWHIHLLFTVLSLRSRVVQLRHLPPGPWLHLGACGFSYYLSVDFLGWRSKQFKHFPPGGWLHLDEIV